MNEIHQNLFIHKVIFTKSLWDTDRLKVKHTTGSSEIKIYDTTDFEQK